MTCTECNGSGRVPGGHGDYDPCGACDLYARVQAARFAVKQQKAAPPPEPETVYDAVEGGPLDDL